MQCFLNIKFQNQLDIFILNLWLNIIITSISLDINFFFNFFFLLFLNKVFHILENALKLSLILIFQIYIIYFKNVFNCFNIFIL